MLNSSPPIPVNKGSAVTVTSLLLFSRSVVSDSVTPWTAARQASLSFTNYLQEFAQTQVHWVSDAIQPSHPLSPPSPALNLSQYQDLFQWVSSSNQVGQSTEASVSASVLPMNIQGWFPLGLASLISLLWLSLGNRIIAGVIELRWCHPGFEWALLQRLVAS